ncbi:MAG: hypothetical protein RH860_12885 [Cytophagales bacterium]
MGREEFKKQLAALGFQIQETAHNNGLYFEYVVEVGRNAGRKVYLGFENLNDFPMNAPHGPHFKSIDSGWINPNTGIHKSKFGTNWIHWSRPFKEWNKTNKTVKEYMSHIKNVLISI